MPTRPFYDDRSERNFAQLTALIRDQGGTVIIGAGLARPAGMPTWPGLVEALAREAGTTAARFSPAAAPRIVETMREHLGDRYLPTLRKEFDLAGRPLPDAYGLLAGAAFARYATTNIEELLWVMATVDMQRPAGE